MKGAKGGLRDRDISNKFRVKNKSSKIEEKEAIKSHRIHDGYNFNEDKFVINKEDNKIKDNSDINNNEESFILKEDTFVNNVSNEEEIKQEEMLSSLDDNDDVVSLEQEEIDKEEQDNDKVENEEHNEEETKENIEENKNEIQEEQIDLNILEDKEEVKQEDITKEEPNKKHNVGIDIDEEKEQEEFNRQDELEKEIFDEINRILKEDYYEIKDLEYQIKVLTQKEEDAVLTDEVEDLKIQLEALLERFDKLREKYEQIEKNKNFDSIRLLDSNYLTYLLTEYKKEVEDKVIMDDLVERLEEAQDYISIMEKVVYIEKEREDLEKSVDEKKEDFSYRDLTYDDLEKSYNDIEKINSEVERFNISMDGILKNVENKIDKMGEVYTKVEQNTRLVVDTNRFFRAMIDFANASILPRNTRGNIMRGMLYADAIGNLRATLGIRTTREERQVSNYTDYSKDILKGMSTIDDYVLKMDDAMDDLSDIRKTFKDEIEEYASEIPEFKEMLENMENMEKQLEEQKYLLNKYNNRMKRELERSNAKVLVYKNINQT